MIKTRHAWLDYARLLSLVLIVLMHTQPRMLCVVVGILAMFFGFSGCLFNSDSYGSFGSFLRRRCQRLLVPYFVFYVVFYILWLAVGRRLDPDVDTLTPLWLWIMGLPKLYKLPVVAPFWFISCLLSMQLIFYWIEKSKSVSRWMPMTLSVAASVAASLCPGSENLNFWNINYALLYMPFYAIGYYMRPFIESGIRLKWWLLLGLASFSIIMMAMVAPLFSSPDWRSLMLVAGGMAAILPMASIATSISQVLKESKLVETMVTGGIVCLAIQNYSIGALRIAVGKVFNGVDVMSWPVSLAITVVTLVITGTSAMLVLRYAPWMLGIKKQNEVR